jgi:hypothetical protein
MTSAFQQVRDMSIRDYLDFLSSDRLPREEIVDLIPCFSYDCAKRAIMRANLYDRYDLNKALDFKKQMIVDDGDYDPIKWKKFEKRLDLFSDRRYYNCNEVHLGAINALKRCGWFPGAPEGDALKKCKAAIIDSIRIIPHTRRYSSILTFVYVVAELHWHKCRLSYLMEVASITSRYWLMYENPALFPVESPRWEMGFYLPFPNESQTQKLEEMRTALRESGWVDHLNLFGGSLEAPREKLPFPYTGVPKIEDIPQWILDWEVTIE